MKIVQVKDLEDCFDGSMIKEMLFDSVVSKKFIHYLGQTGELDYYPDFPRPFYSVNSPKKYIIKGVEDNNTARIIMYRENMDAVLAELTEFVCGYSE